MASVLHVCSDPAEAQELFEPQGLYLKPVAKISISVQLPQLKTPGKSISSWEVMEKIKNCTKPDKFTTLKVSKSTLEFIRFEGETETRSHMKVIIARLDNKTIKLTGFPDCLKVRAAEAKINFPTRHDWDSYFRDAKNMNEMRPGERPDTIHFQMLPCRWFTNKKDGDGDKPSEYVLKKVFETFGEVRCVDIPLLDPYRREMVKNSGTIQTFSFGQDITFEAFVQFQEYIGFVKAMTALRGMKLIHKSDDANCFAADVKVDFDRSKHLSDKNIRKRRQEREKLILLEKEKEERVRKEREEEERRRTEEKRKFAAEEKEREHKREEKLRKREQRKKQKQIQKEQVAEQQRLRTKHEEAEREKFCLKQKVAANRLLSVLFNEVKIKKQKEELKKRMAALSKEQLQRYRDHKLEDVIQQTDEKVSSVCSSANPSLLKHSVVVKVEANKHSVPKSEQLLKEQQLRERIIQNMKLKKEQSREKLRHDLSTRTKLRSVLVMKTKTYEKDIVKEPNIPKLKSVLVSHQ